MYKTNPTIPATTEATIFLLFIILSLLEVKNNTSIGFMIIVGITQIAAPVDKSARPAPIAEAAIA